MSDIDAIVEDPVTGLFGFRLEMGRGHGGIRMQARRTGFATAKEAKTEYGRPDRGTDDRARCDATLQRHQPDEITTRLLPEIGKTCRVARRARSRNRVSGVKRPPVR
jgi:hypothetical protein